MITWWILKFTSGFEFFFLGWRSKKTMVISWTVLKENQLMNRCSPVALVRPWFIVNRPKCLIFTTLSSDCFLYLAWSVFLTLTWLHSTEIHWICRAMTFYAFFLNFSDLLAHPVSNIMSSQDESALCPMFIHIFSNKCWFIYYEDSGKATTQFIWAIYPEFQCSFRRAEHITSKL